MSLLLSTASRAIIFRESLTTLTQYTYIHITYKKHGKFHTNYYTIILPIVFPIVDTAIYVGTIQINKHYDFTETETVNCCHYGLLNK